MAGSCPWHGRTDRWVVAGQRGRVVPITLVYGSAHPTPPPSHSPSGAAPGTSVPHTSTSVVHPPTPVPVAPSPGTSHLPRAGPWIARFPPAGTGTSLPPGTMCQREGAARSWQSGGGDSGAHGGGTGTAEVLATSLADAAVRTWGRLRTSGCLWATLATSPLAPGEVGKCWSPIAQMGKLKRGARRGGHGLGSPMCPLRQKGRRRRWEPRGVLVGRGGGVRVGNQGG